jgi:hypothetical protein
MNLTPPLYVPTPLPFPAPQSILNTLALLTDDFEWSVAQAYGLQDYLAKLLTLDRVRVQHTAAVCVGPAYARKVAPDRWMLTVLQGTSVTFVYYTTAGLRAACEQRRAADRLDVAGLAAWGAELGFLGYLDARREMAEGASSWPPAAQRVVPGEAPPTLRDAIAAEAARKAAAPPARRAGDGEGGAGFKLDLDKAPWWLFPWDAASQVVRVLDYGRKKYAPDNWRKVPDARTRYFEAGLRHLLDWKRGERLDPESGLPHLGHAACCVLFILALEEGNAADKK